MNGAFGKADTRRTEFERDAAPHLPGIYRAALAMFGNPAEAEDVAQEVFVQAWQSFDRFEPGSNCRAWLFKILSFKAGHHRRKWFRRRREAAVDEILENTTEAPVPIPEGLKDEDVLAALARVPEAFREVLILADVQEFSYKEIAEIAEIPIGTVMSRLSRARGYLRRELASMGIKASSDFSTGGSPSLR
ncbi:MAG: sigma-70 family RNA polymerase sigma factor [Bryobacterales bacterium]|nr:sigma-70 family RNA polymerase sigma factor [Bryobacterales bacterium]